MTINPVTERDSYILDFATDVSERLAELGPNAAILNGVPYLNKGVLKLDQFILEPLDLLGDLEFMAQFVELGTERSDNRLCRRHISELEALEVVGESSLTRDELSLELVSDTSCELVDLGLGLIDSTLDGIHSGRELTADDRVLKCVSDKTKLRR